eukprot:13401028-Alexandrium_andersonii.AAC.1
MPIDNAGSSTDDHVLLKRPAGASPDDTFDIIKGKGKAKGKSKGTGKGKGESEVDKLQKAVQMMMGKMQK